MNSFSGFRKSGIFSVAPGIEAQGDLTLKGSETKLDLFASDFFNTQANEDYCIKGTLQDRTKVSLIDCVTTKGLGGGYKGSEKYHFASVFPHYVIFGDEHITSSDKKITSLNFQVDDAFSIFYDFDAFGMDSDASSYIADIVQKKREPTQNANFSKDSKIFYFTGKYEIFSAETIFGTVSASHQPSFSFPGPHGITVTNKIGINISFKQSASISEAIISIQTLLRFLEIIAGRPQRIMKLNFWLPSTEGRPTILDVYWSLSPTREGEEGERRSHPTDLPIQAAETPELFAKVLANWLARDHDWRDARNRLSIALGYQSIFNIDRIVGTANMFDILPASAVPKKAKLSDDLEIAKKESRKLFKDLPESIERDSILGALGRLGNATLKHKVHARAKLICNEIPHNLPDLDLVINQAIDCRNYFVHGSQRKLDYIENFNHIIFFTQTLEFIFAASDLIDCGWNIKEWIKRSSTTHPFGQFLSNYQSCLSDLKHTLRGAA